MLLHYLLALATLLCAQEWHYFPRIWPAGRSLVVGYVVTYLTGQVIFWWVFLLRVQQAQSAERALRLEGGWRRD